MFSLRKEIFCFFDESSKVVQGKRYYGCAIIDGLSGEVKQMGQLPNNWSAQTCELYALNQAFTLLKRKKGIIYPDSKYTYGVVHTFGKMGGTWVDQ